MGGTEQLARFAGLVAGLVLAFAAAAPFTGVPPQGVSGGAATPGTVAIEVVPHGELTLVPTGPALPPTAIRSEQQPRGASLAVRVQNISALPLRLSVRLKPVSATLSDAATVRGSVAGSVVFDGTLRAAEAWSPATARAIEPGATATLRLRIKLRDGVTPEQWLGRRDSRQLEFQPSIVAPPTTPSATTPTTPAPPVTTPPAPTTPGQAP